MTKGIVKAAEITQQAHAIAQIADVQEAMSQLREIGDMAEALRKIFAHQKGEKQTAAEYAAASCEAIREGGKRLLEITPGSGRPKKDSTLNLFQEAVSAVGGTTEAWRWQQAAKIPDGDYEEFRDRKIAAGKYLTLASLVKKAQHYEADDDAEPIPDELNGIIHGDFIEVCQRLPEKSVHLIFTDPPYGREHADLYPTLAKAAARVLVPGGSLITYCGHQVIADVIGEMAEHLKFWWLCSLCYRDAGAVSHQRALGVRVNSKPILWFCKGGRRNASVFVDEHLPIPAPDKSGVVMRDEGDDWQQPEFEARYYIEKLTKIDNVVLDPMCGSGTTCAAALKLGRKHVGIEKDGKHATAARQRIEQCR